MSLVKLKGPIQCHLWQKQKTYPTYLDFEEQKEYCDDGHLTRRLLRCKDCGQLYFFEFYEVIDWENGNDPQYVTYIPIDTEVQASEMSKMSVFELLKFTPCLRSDFPKDAKAPTGWYWRRDHL